MYSCFARPCTVRARPALAAGPALLLTEGARGL
jgi:hypothetical protein